VIDRVGLVQGDFRQEEICTAWRNCLTDDRYFPLVSLDIRCGSGTYIRSLAHEIGRRLGCGAVLAGLRRVRVGSWHVNDPDVIGLSWPR
jgi:tRNA U55 pseudouridine synthase TruB